MAAIGSLTPEFLKILGADGDGLKVLNSTTLTTADTPKAKQFVTEMTSFLGGDAGKVATNSNEFGQTGWASVQLLKQALTGATDFTGGRPAQEAADHVRRRSRLRVPARELL